MINGIKKRIKSLGITVAVAMAKGDKELLKGTGTETSEKDSMVSRSFSENEALRAIQMQQFSQQQITEHYRLLDKMDSFHGKLKLGKKIADGYWEDVTDNNGKQLYNEDGTPKQIWINEPVFETVISGSEDFLESKQKLGDHEEGYETILWLSNNEIKMGDIALTDQTPTFQTLAELDSIVTFRDALEIDRGGYMVYGVPKIEDYTESIFIKHKENQAPADNTCLIEFYCYNYNATRARIDAHNGIFNDVMENAFETICSNPSVFPKFTDISAFDMLQSTATRNAIPHRFEDLKFDKVKRLRKGFVIKFFGKKI